MVEGIMIGVMIVVLGFFGYVQYVIWDNKKLNTPMFAKGDTITFKYPPKPEPWEEQQIQALKNLRIRVEEIGNTAYRIVYSYNGRDVAAETVPFIRANTLFVKEEVKKPLLSIVKSEDVSPTYH